MKLGGLACAVAGYCALSLTGCVMGPDYQTPTTPLAAHWALTPGEAGHSRAVEGEVDPRWWDRFGDAHLSALVRDALRSNFDLQRAASRLEQSRALRRQIAADSLPAVDAGLEYSRGRNSQRGLNDPSGRSGKQAFNLWNSGLGFSWEADLWGRVKRSVEAADASVRMAEEDRHGVQLLVIRQTAQQYIQLRGTQQAQAVVEQNLKIAQRTLELTQLQVQEGVATDLEVSEAASQVAEMQARLAPLQQNSAQLINALSLLLGKAPRALQTQLAPLGKSRRTRAMCPLVCRASWRNVARTSAGLTRICTPQRRPSVWPGPIFIRASRCPATSGFKPCSCRIWAAGARAVLRSGPA